MTWGRHPEVVKQRKEKNPVLHLKSHLVPIWESYWLLSGQRSLNELGFQPLQYSEINNYMAILGGWIPRNLIPYFVKMILVLDQEFLNIQAEKK